MVKVKICANKSLEDAKMSIDAGADIIGILVGQEHTSNDFVDEYKAKEIADYANGKCDVSLVTHLTNADEIIKLSTFIGNNTIQLHSDINEEEVEKIKLALPNIKLVRLIHISSDGKICTDYKKMKYADYYLLDSFNLKTNQVGGTGLTHDWNKSKELIVSLDKPTFLAGGLNPENVSTAIKLARPYGVDVNSGCKNEAGVKDKEKVRRFVENAKKVSDKRIIFDLDNTLLFISDEWSKIYQFFIDKYNYKLTPKELYQGIGTFENNSKGIVVTKEYFVNYLNEQIGLNFTQEIIEDLLDLYANIPLLKTNIIYDVLSYLNEKYELIVYSNWFTDNQIQRLRNYNLDKFFTRIYGWDKLPVKPSEEGIKAIVGEDDINDYVFIGDVIEIDVKVPKKLGMDTIFYNRKNIEQNEYKEISSLEKLKELF